MHSTPRYAASVVALLLVVLSICSGSVLGQTNIRAWSAQGQVWVVWQVDATDPFTYDLYRVAAAAGAPPTPLSQWTLAGRLFKPEWQGERLKLAKPSATWVAPLPGGGTYSLTSTEGLFVFTPHAAGDEYFAVIRNGAATISAANRTASPVPVMYDPQNIQIRPQPQFSDTTAENHPFTVWAMWADGGVSAGNDTPARPDYPIMASFAKNGSPHVFATFEPIAGIGSLAGAYPLQIALHGGGGNFTNWRPDAPGLSNVGLAFTAGLWVTHDDPIYRFRGGGGGGPTAQDTNIFWFGYAPSMNPFVNPGSTPLPSGTVVVGYTLRRLDWVLDWLLQRSPYATSAGGTQGIDPARVNITGHSMGSQGTLLHSRYRPERYASATAFNPGLQGAGVSGASTQLLGTVGQNLPTNLPAPVGWPTPTLGVTDVFYVENRINLTQRDFAFSRIYLGRNDQSNNADWGPDKVDRFTNINNAAWGMHLYWDDRDHPVSSWNQISPPNFPGVSNTVAEWVRPPAPITAGQTQRAMPMYNIRYRADQTFPAFYNDDQDPSLAGRQPDMGSGNPNSGAPWGTWSGYYDWDQATLIDAPARWAATVFLTGLSPTAVDNAPVASAQVSIAVRKPQAFAPGTGETLVWALRRVSDGGIVQSGQSVVGVSGLVAVPNLTVLRDPLRTRLVIHRACAIADVAGGGPGAGGDGIIDGEDFVAFINSFSIGDPAIDPAADVAGAGPGGLLPDGIIDGNDFIAFINAFGTGCP